ncbi:MAG: (R)-stereoselective amidase [Planctomycetes bacterium]|nr:(R)-stereoselective amidase [Planctomycetota bacterium]
MKPFTAALAQVAPRLADVPANLELHARTVRDAAARGAELVVFPELSLTGYVLEEATPEVALRTDSPEWDALRAMSRDAALVVGFVEEASGGRFFNSAAFLDGGEVAHVHRKVFLPTHGVFDEMRHFAPGERIRAFDTRFGRCGILVCRDFWHLGPAYVLAAQDVDVILVASASPGRGAAGDDGRFQSTASVSLLGDVYARSFGCHVLHANRCGVEEGVTFTGASEAFGPSGERLGKGRDLDEDLVLVRVDPAERRAARLRMPFLREERPHLVLRELERALAERAARD